MIFACVSNTHLSASPSLCLLSSLCPSQAMHQLCSAGHLGNLSAVMFLPSFWAMLCNSDSSMASLLSWISLLLHLQESLSHGFVASEGVHVGCLGNISVRDECNHSVNLSQVQNPLAGLFPPTATSASPSTPCAASLPSPAER